MSDALQNTVGHAIENSWTRRQALILGGTALASAGLAACSGSDVPSAPAGLPFAQPNELVSKNGRLEVTLRAEESHVPHGTGTRFAYTYNGTTPGPTLRVRPGDTISLTLENRLTEHTNLHTHGLHVSPNQGSDDVFITINPGESHTYTYELPTTHRSSMCWYHPHHHGMVAGQISGGMFGAIIVEDQLDEIDEIANAHERVLLLSDPRIGSDASVLEVSHMDVMMGREGDSPLVNGLRTPNLQCTAGELERWRILNASPSRYYRLAVDDHQMMAIGTDGSRLAKPVSVDSLLLAPGERAEVLIAPSKAGTYWLRTLGYDRGRPGMGGGMGGGMGASSKSGEQAELLSLEVQGSSGAATLPGKLLSETDLDAGPATDRRPVELGMVGGGGGGMQFTIDGVTFDANRTNISAAAGTTEDWVITNTSNMDHPFHLHVWPFRVIERSSGDADLPGWKDTVNVPPGGSVTVRIPLTDLAGRTVYHCHILDHEDQGMMGIIEVR